MASPASRNFEVQSTPLALPANLGSTLQINVYCPIVIIERPIPSSTNLSHPMPSSPRGVWVPAGGIRDFVKTLYQNILDRDPESQTVVDNWTRHTYNHGLAHTVGGFFTSDEYTAKCMSPEATVDKFYRAVLGRQAEPGGRAHWIEVIRRGTSLWRVSKDFVGSQEYRQKVQAGMAPDPIYWP